MQLQDAARRTALPVEYRTAIESGGIQIRG
jgi:hypothetical protein